MQLGILVPSGHAQNITSMPAIISKLQDLYFYLILIEITLKIDWVIIKVISLFIICLLVLILTNQAYIYSKTSKMTPVII